MTLKNGRFISVRYLFYHLNTLSSSVLAFHWDTSARASFLLHQTTCILSSFMYSNIFFGP